MDFGASFYDHVFLTPRVTWMGDEVPLLLVETLYLKQRY